MQFEEFGLIEPLLRAVREEGYAQPTPIQQQAIPHLLEGKDLLGCAQTGTGKTAAFALPILHRLAPHDHPKRDARPIRSLVLTPTRELAAQIGQSFATYGRHTGLIHTTVYGGVKQGPQAKALKKGVDILVATPGRLLDLMGQRLVKLKHLEVFVLDEADRMLDMGFINDIRRVIAALPAERQTLFFSATMPPAIQSLADSILRKPVEVRIAPERPAAETVEHSVYFVERNHKRTLLSHLLSDGEIKRALVFTRTKVGADRVTMHLRHADVLAQAIHSDKPQAKRQQALANFKRGKTRVLVASDIAARGLDVDDISHVINFDIPDEPETYVHRIGRTGRAGASGKALSFCSMAERSNLADIEKLIRRAVNVVEDHPFRSEVPRLPKQEPKPHQIGLRRRPGRRRRLL